MEQKFKRYVAIQFSGMYNMITEAYSVMNLGNINFDDYCYIQEHYCELKEQFKETWEEGKKLGDEMREKIHGQS